MRRLICLNLLVSFLQGILTVVSEELADCPLYYVIDKLANVIHSSTPSMLQFRSSLIRLGYKVSCSHANCNGLKTNAPNSGMLINCFLFSLSSLGEHKRSFQAFNLVRIISRAFFNDF